MKDLRNSQDLTIRDVLKCSLLARVQVKSGMSEEEIETAMLAHEAGDEVKPPTCVVFEPQNHYHKRRALF